jgi:16S rRNA (adenine1518-N6/adenine1519-N6)-dimethyltransferase
MKILPKKSLGQNFLIDNEILNLITNSGSINSNDIVLEVGPGTGNLTEKILKKKPKKLIVVEKDKNLSVILKNKFDKDIEIINDNILNYNQDIYHNKKIIIFGNLPYNISTQILTSWIKINNLNNFCKRFVLMFQKEVADRILAEHNSKNYGRLSIISSWKMDIKKIIDINPSSFFPPPKIKSTLLIFKPKNNYYKLSNPKNLEHVTNIFFNQRRKMIKKPLKFLFKNYEKVAEELSLDLNLRPQNLTNLTYYKICSYYENLLK